MSGNAIPCSVVLEALNRLNRYYAGRARSALRVLQRGEETTLEKVLELGVSAAQWQGKRDAVVKVAENLSVELKELDASTPQQQNDRGAITDHVGELKRILAQIEERNGLVQSVESYQHSKRLHKQARMHLEQIENGLEVE